MNIDNLKKARKDKGVSQAEMSKILALSPNTYRNYEQGIREPNHTILCKIADFLGVSVDYLLGRTFAQNPIELINELALDDKSLVPIEMFLRLSAQEQQTIIDFMLALKKSQEEGNKNA